MNINIVAAVGKNNELGKDNKLIWRFKEDLKFFKELTMGSPIVMGRNTFESIDGVLPGRTNIVISRNEILNDKIELYKSIKEFLNAYRDYDGDVFIIGGSIIYKEFIDLATELYLTEIDATDAKADVYFPNFDKSNYSREVLSEVNDYKIKYKHVLYKKLK